MRAPRVQFKPTQFNNACNVTRQPWWRELLQYGISLLLLLLAFYLLTGWLVDHGVDYITPRQETAWFGRLTNSMVASIEEQPRTDAQQKQQVYLRNLFNKIPSTLKPQGYTYRVLIDYDMKQPNAFALPGGTIIVTQTLLEMMPSENALMFVLGHELGHFQQRDHLRRLGRQLILSSALLLLTGGQDGLSLQSISNLEMLRHSRAAETTADIVGVETLMAVYGHAGGSTSFFEIMLAEHGELGWAEFGQTHPLSKKRIALIKCYIAQQDYPKNPVQALAY